jgi:hypothetical protein
LVRAWPESISQKDNMGQTPLDKAKMTTSSSSSLPDGNPDDEVIQWLEEVMEEGALSSMEED